MSSQEKRPLHLRGYGVDAQAFSRLCEQWAADGHSAADGSADIPDSFSFEDTEPDGQVLLLGSAAMAGKSEENHLDDIFLPPLRSCIEIDDVDPLAQSDLLSRIPDQGLFLSLTTATAFPLFLSKAFCCGLVSRNICDQEEADKIEIALQEAVSNALIHGNLGISSQLREDLAGYKVFSETIVNRLAMPEYASRRLQVAVTWDGDMVEVAVCDEGPGYEQEDLDNSQDRGSEKEAAERAYGRGLELISMLCSGIELSNSGRCLVMEFQKATPAPEADDDGKDEADNIRAGIVASSHPAPEVSHDDGLLGRRILVVDDDVIARELIVSYLTVYGFRTLETAEDGIEALEKVKTFHPDLIILDVVMPRMDGFEVCRQLREDIKYQDLPVLVQTAYDKPEDREHVFAVGATDMVIKPIHKMELIARVRIHLEKHLLIQNLRLYRERVASELDFARGMQRDLLPSDDVIAHVMAEHSLDVAAHFAPSSELGGDFWGMIETGEGNLGIYIVDFTGHGVMSALNTFRLHTLLHEARYFAGNPSVFLKSLNRRLCDLLPLGQFATMLYGVVNRQEDTFTYAASAAPSPLMGTAGRGDKRLQFFEGSGLPLGISKDAEYENRVVPLPANGFVFLYSDALTESVLADGTSLEDEGLMALVAKQKAVNESKTFVSDLVADFLSLMSSPPTDDLTAVCLIRKE